MGKKHFGDFLGGLGPDLKKELLQTLFASLVEGLKKDEQKEILQSAIALPPRSRELIDMVGH